MTSEEINPVCVERLRSADLPHRVAVVGSGLSSPYVSPLWTLKKNLCARCRIGPGPEGESFWNLAQRAYDGDPCEYYKVIKETYGHPFPWSANAYELLVQMRFLGLATLNYDSQFPKALMRCDPDALFFVYPQFNRQPYLNPMEFSHARQRLIALHGYCNANNPDWEKQVILKASDYEQHYFHSGPLHQWWSTLLLARSCIFIGTTLHELGLRNVIKSLAVEQGDTLRARNHLHLVPTQGSSPTRETAPKMIWDLIEQVPYLPIDEHHGGLLEVLSEVSGISLAPPGPKLPTVNPTIGIDSLSPDDLDFFS